jgi:hypothetical protein
MSAIKLKSKCECASYLLKLACSPSSAPAGRQAGSQLRSRPGRARAYELPAAAHAHAYVRVYGSGSGSGSGTAHAAPQDVGARLLAHPIMAHACRLAVPAPQPHWAQSHPMARWSLRAMYAETNSTTVRSPNHIVILSLIKFTHTNKEHRYYCINDIPNNKCR